MLKNYVISVDFGGTKILAALVNTKGQIISRSKIATQVQSSKSLLIKNLVQVIKNIIQENEITEKEVKAICVGIPGSVNPFTGIIGTAPNLNIKNFDFREALAKYFSIPVLFVYPNVVALLYLHCAKLVDILQSFCA